MGVLSGKASLTRHVSNQSLVFPCPPLPSNTKSLPNPLRHSTSAHLLVKLLHLLQAGAGQVSWHSSVNLAGLSSQLSTHRERDENVLLQAGEMSAGGGGGGMLWLPIIRQYCRACTVHKAFLPAFWFVR